MQITIKGEMSLAEVRQALYEKFVELEEEFAVAYSQGATLYLNPSNGQGDTVVVRRDGKVVAKLHSNGPYRSAAEQFNI